jgi:hypothetical protein
MNKLIDRLKARAEALASTVDNQVSEAIHHHGPKIVEQAKRAPDQIKEAAERLQAKAKERLRLAAEKR